MTKKITAIFLALMMVFTLAMPTFAANDENQKLTSAEISDAVNVAVSALVGADDDATVIVDNALISDIKAGADTPKEVAGLLSGLLFIEEDLAEQVSSDIVENSKYTVKVIENGKTTVYCSIDFEAFPEIFDARVFLLAIGKIQDKCDEVAAENGVDITGDAYSPMGYTHIAGELSLHMILAKLSKDTASWNPLSEWIYEHAGVADLNVDENRFPSFLITGLGEFIVGLMEFITSIF